MFLYFIEGDERDRPDLSKIPHAIEGSPRKGYNTKGLNGRGGHIVADKSVTAPLRMDLSTQDWKQVNGVGYLLVEEKDPEFYAREKQLVGKPVEIKGKQWNIPEAVTFAEIGDKVVYDYMVSRYLDVDDDGSITYGDVEEKYEPLLEIAMKWHSLEDETFGTDEEFFRAAATAISFNYKLGLVECTMLKLLTIETATQIIPVVAASELYQELQKKRLASLEKTTDQDSPEPDSNTSDGEAAATHATA